MSKEKKPDKKAKSCIICKNKLNKDTLVVWNKEGFWNRLAKEGIDNDKWKTLKPEERRPIYRRYHEEFGEHPFLNTDGTQHTECYDYLVEEPGGAKEPKKETTKKKDDVKEIMLNREDILTFLRENDDVTITDIYNFLDEVDPKSVDNTITGLTEEGLIFINPDKIIKLSHKPKEEKKEELEKGEPKKEKPKEEKPKEEKGTFMSLQETLEITRGIFLKTQKIFKLIAEGVHDIEMGLKRVEDNLVDVYKMTELISKREEEIKNTKT
jgi:hypothetical protein